ncbi:right-handed parallel beta-helix repeat-containing protein [Kaarinaea lacus]
MKGSILSGVFAILLCSNVTAANLYVNSSGSGANCTEPDPCPTINMAIGNAAAGDSIKVAAGTYNENVFVPPGKNGLTISGAGMEETVVRSAGGRPGVFAPPTVSVDAVFQIVSEDVTIEKLTAEHPVGVATKRELGFFVTPFARNTTIQKCKIVRNSSGEPTMPGSRGVFVIRAGGVIISKNVLRGSYQDHIHVPGHDMEIVKNDVADAPRLGIVVIQETEASNNNNNIIANNIIANSGSDAIQVQSDSNLIIKNIIRGNGGAAIKLCGLSTIGDCIEPFDEWSEATGNTVIKNHFSGNGIDDVVDNGTDNVTD